MPIFLETSASFLVTTASFAISSSYARSSSFAISASYAKSASFATSASFAVTSSAATSITFKPVSASHADNANNATSASWAPEISSFPMTSQVIYVPMQGIAMMEDDSDATWYTEQGRMRSNAGGNDSSCALSPYLAKGMVLTKVEALVRAESSHISINLYKRVFSAGGVVTLVATDDSVGTTEQIVTLSGLSETIGDELWWIDNQSHSSNKYNIWGYRLTVNVANVTDMVS